MDLRGSAPCDSGVDEWAWKVFANRVRYLLRIDERQPAEGACSEPPPTSFDGSEIELTVSPVVIIDRTYDVNRR